MEGGGRASVGGGGVKGHVGGLGSLGERSEGFAGSLWVLNHHLHHPRLQGPSSSSLLWSETSPHLQRIQQTV